MELTVTLPDHDYKIWIERGALQSIGSWVKSLWSSRRIVIITDKNVDDIYGLEVLHDVKEAGFDASLIAVEPGEKSKSLNTAQNLYEYLAECGLTRNDGIIALGGGVVGDLAGFVASTYMRGLHFLQVPTTLLAQVDSSVGGKTAVNTKSAKNLVGTFAQPDGVLIDPETLKTLEERRVREGIAEIVKSAAIADDKLWEQLSEMESKDDLLAQAESVIAACCRVKRKVVEADEMDHGERLILNFGHTIGHAIEQSVGYGVITHGEAVAIGMVQISKQAAKLGMMPIEFAPMLTQQLVKFGLPTSTDNWDEAKLYKALTHDKKAQGKQIRIVLLEQIGKAKLVELPTTDLREFLKKDK